jgi:ABC-2 type transport system ATP-binding protein
MRAGDQRGPVLSTCLTNRRVTDAIQIEGLRVVRGGNVVLRDISLAIPAGRVTGLLGPSGCGKSTLMRSIVGVQTIASGEVRVLGELAGSVGLRTRVGYDTQAPSVYADLTARENLKYFASVLGADHGRIDSVIASVDMDAFAERVTGGLSGGERSRVSLAVALLNEPRLLVLDEPTVGLDPILRNSLWELFHSLAANGATLLVSSHVMDEAARCDELLLMREGKILAQTTPGDLLARTGAGDMEGAFLRLIETLASDEAVQGP